MFDYSLLASFTAFVVFSFIKIRPVLTKSLDTHIQGIRGEFDAVALQARNLEKQIAALKQQMDAQKIVHGNMLHNAKPEAVSMEEASRRAVQNIRDYYERLRASGQSYWAERLEQYGHDVLKEKVLSSVRVFCQNSKNARNVEQLTEALVPAASSTSPK